MQDETITITGVGSYLPPQAIKNEEIPGYQLTDEMWNKFWGTCNRHRLSSEDNFVKMGVRSIENALEMAELQPEDLDAILVSTSIAVGLEDGHSMSMFPRPAVRVRNRLKACRAVPLDIDAGCASFLIALETAITYISSGKFDRIAIVAIDCFSRILDNTDPTGILFGDGSGSVIIEKKSGGHGYVHSCHFSDSSNYDLVGAHWTHPRQGEGQYRPYFYFENSPRTHEFLPHLVPKSIRQVLKGANLRTDEIDLFVLHQPGKILIDEWRREFNLTADNQPVIHNECACLSASTMPITLDHAVRNGQLEKGQRILFAGFGIGWTWGAHIWEWNG